MTDMTTRVSDEEVERLIARLHAYAPEEGEAWTVASLLAERRALESDFRTAREAWELETENRIAAEAQVAALLAERRTMNAHIAGLAAQVGALIEYARALSTAVTAALAGADLDGYLASRLLSADARFNHHLGYLGAALRTSTPEEAGHGG